MTNISSLQSNRDLILEQENQFCHQVSSEVLDKPKLGVWMILIPVFCVFYFWELKKYSDGRKGFAANFLIVRERVLNSVYEAILAGEQPDIEKIVEAAEIPEEGRQYYRNWLSVLNDHYSSLFNARGQSFEELVRSAYRGKKQYIKFIEELNRVEREYSNTLTPHLDMENSEAAAIVSRIEHACESLRRQKVKEIFG